MSIVEAVKAARDTRMAFRRANAGMGAAGRVVLVDFGLWLAFAGGLHRWCPSAEDIIATDWEMVDP